MSVYEKQNMYWVLFTKKLERFIVFAYIYVRREHEKHIKTLIYWSYKCLPRMWIELKLKIISKGKTKHTD